MAATGLTTAYFSSGSGAPSTAPSVAAGEYALYQNTANGQMYVWGLNGTPAWATLGGAGGGVLAVHAYAAGSDTAATSTSTSFADVDATNQAVTFTAPASGNVLVRVTGIFSASNATNNVYFGLRESTTDLANTQRINIAAVATDETQTALLFYLSGITAGSHTYKLSFKTSNAGTTAQVWTGPTLGQTIYEVIAAP